MDLEQYVFYKWPVFKSYDEISIHYVISDKTLEKLIMTKYPQIQNIVIQTSE